MSLFWQSKKINISDLKPAKYNPRKKVDGEFKSQLLKSIEKFNIADPIVINADNTIIGGHQRYYILIEKGIPEVDVRIPNRQLTEQEEKELNLRLNKNVGEWDNELLTSFDEDMLKDVGFTSDELEDMFNLELDTEGETKTVANDDVFVECPNCKTRFRLEDD